MSATIKQSHGPSIPKGAIALPPGTLEGFNPHDPMEIDFLEGVMAEKLRDRSIYGSMAHLTTSLVGAAMLWRYASQHEGVLGRVSRVAAGVLSAKAVADSSLLGYQVGAPVHPIQFAETGSFDAGAASMAAVETRTEHNL